VEIPKVLGEKPEGIAKEISDLLAIPFFRIPYRYIKA
jgi:hypothetical protein